MKGKKTALYRHFDKDKNLLYIGISLSPIYRLDSHGLNANWFEKIAFIEVEWFNNRKDALNAEKTAIKLERPTYNKIGTGAERIKKFSIGDILIAKKNIMSWNEEKTFAEAGDELEVKEVILNGYFNVINKTRFNKNKESFKITYIDVFNLKP